MNVEPGTNSKTKKIPMRDGWYFDSRGRKVMQSMQLNGEPKGMRLVLTERGLYRPGMKGPEMRAVLTAQPDFREQKTAVEELLAKHDILCSFLPVGHAELNPIELFWKTFKDDLGSWCDYTIAGLRKRVPVALESCVPLSRWFSFFDHVHAFVFAYARGLDYLAAKADVDSKANERRATRSARQQQQQQRSSAAPAAQQSAASDKPEQPRSGRSRSRASRADSRSQDQRQQPAVAMDESADATQKETQTHTGTRDRHPPTAVTDDSTHRSRSQSSRATAQAQAARMDQSTDEAVETKGHQPSVVSRSCFVKCA